jgi:hypothetical protein
VTDKSPAQTAGRPRRNGRAFVVSVVARDGLEPPTRGSSVRAGATPDLVDHLGPDSLSPCPLVQRRPVHRLPTRDHDRLVERGIVVPAHVGGQPIHDALSRRDYPHRAELGLQGSGVGVGHDRVAEGQRARRKLHVVLGSGVFELASSRNVPEPERRDGVGDRPRALDSDEVEIAAIPAR